MPERRWLCLLQVGLVGHQRPDVIRGEFRAAVPEPAHLVNQAEQLVAQVQPHRDPGGFAPRAPGVQPAGGVAEPLDEEVLAGVVRLAKFRVVGELVRGHRLRLQEQFEHLPGGGARDEPAPQEVKHVRHVSEVESLVQERRVRVLQREPGLDQLRCCTADWRAAPPYRVHQTHPSGSAARAARERETS